MSTKNTDVQLLTTRRDSLQQRIMDELSSFTDRHLSGHITPVGTDDYVLDGVTVTASTPSWHVPVRIGVHYPKGGFPVYVNEAGTKVHLLDQAADVESGDVFFDRLAGLTPDPDGAESLYEAFEDIAEQSEVIGKLTEHARHAGITWEGVIKVLRPFTTDEEKDPTRFALAVDYGWEVRSWLRKPVLMLSGRQGSGAVDKFYYDGRSFYRSMRKDGASDVRIGVLIPV